MSAQLLAETLFPDDSLPSGPFKYPQDVATCLVQSKKTKSKSEMELLSFMTPALQLHSQFCSEITGDMIPPLLGSANNRV